MKKLMFNMLVLVVWCVGLALTLQLLFSENGGVMHQGGYLVFGVGMLGLAACKEYGGGGAKDMGKLTG